jgi:hypothetical protein
MQCFVRHKITCKVTLSTEVKIYGIYNILGLGLLILMCLFS